MIRDVEDRESMIDSIVEAVKNKAVVVVRNLDQLPDDWQSEIKAKAKS